MNLASIDDLINREGGYVNDPNDPGGETNFGITVNTARASGYHGDMKDMPRVFAQSLYLRDYWQVPKFDQIDKLFPALAEKLFDIGVNLGPHTGVMYLQRAMMSLGYLCSETGMWGNNDAICLTGFLTKRKSEGQKVLLFMVAAQQSAHYIDLAIKNPDENKFEYGWQLNRSLYEVKI